MKMVREQADTKGDHYDFRERRKWGGGLPPSLTTPLTAGLLSPGCHRPSLTTHRHNYRSSCIFTQSRRIRWRHAAGRRTVTFSLINFRRTFSPDMDSCKRDASLAEQCYPNVNAGALNIKRTIEMPLRYWFSWPTIQFDLWGCLIAILSFEQTLSVWYRAAETRGPFY